MESRMESTVDRTGRARTEEDGEGAARSIERELGELRREILESRNLVIKSDNVLRSLHAELKTLGKRHEEFERRSWLASGFAYGGFALLAAFGATFAARGYVASAREEAAQVKAQAAELSAASQKVQRQTEAVRVASAAAARAYGQMEGDPAGRLAAATAVAALDRSLLSPLESRALDDRARSVRQELAAEALEKGRAAFRRNDMKAVASELGRYFAVADPASADVVASFDLGVALWQGKSYAAAAVQLRRFVQLGKGLKNQDYAELLLGEAQEQLGQKEEALASYRQGLAEHPVSEFMPQLRHHLSKLEPPKAAAKAVPAPAPKP